MKFFLMILAFATGSLGAKTQPLNYNTYPVYTGKDLGLTWSAAVSQFRIWSPPAEKAELIIYENGEGGAAVAVIEMKKMTDAVWYVSVEGNQQGKFYVFRVQVNGQWLNEVPDPYARVVGINGKRAMIADLNETNPVGWEKDKPHPLKNATDAVIYELHIRDASIAVNSGIHNKGKYIGLTEKATVNKEGLATGLDHLKELGVTHIHLLPFFDYNSIDEKNPGVKYNWGYDPLNYNAPEGSYSTNAYDGITRIKELKQLIQTLHVNGINVVMDVVYNHTALTENSSFNQLVPGYYYRHSADGKFSNATACGNETASERPMMRKFILESMKYWAQEYHIDGFRVDLMGVHDIVTMNLISRELHRIKPGILLYGEGWTAGVSPLPDSLRAIKKNAHSLENIAVFSDDLRDGIKGSVFSHNDPGFVSGKPGMEESIKFGIVAACRHAQINYGKVNYSNAPYAAQPHNTIAYCECHDNHALWDKLTISVKEATWQERKEMQELALAIVLTSQGIPFLHAGSEFLRSKKGIENSFESADSINEIDWELKSINNDVFLYVKSLIGMRKAHPAFRMKTADQIEQHLRFMDGLPPQVVGFTINGAAVKDRWKKIVVFYNGSAEDQLLRLPVGKWKLFKGETKASQYQHTEFTVKPRSCSILFQSE